MLLLLLNKIEGMGIKSSELPTSGEVLGDGCFSFFALKQLTNACVMFCQLKKDILFYTFVVKGQVRFVHEDFHDRE